MELLIGSGNRHFKVWGGEFSHLTTLDMDAGLKPDVVHDLNDLPLPFDDNVFDEIHCVDVLEHIGSQGDWRQWFGMFDEFWRILKPGGRFSCAAPRADSVWAWGDPGHTRIIVEEQLTYLVRPQYAQVGKTAMTDYTSYFVGDWDITRKEYTPDHFKFELTAFKPVRDPFDFVDSFLGNNK